MLQNSRRLRTENFITRVKNGEFEKNHLTNHGQNFTGDPEKLALESFENYEGSCGRILMEMRLKEKGNRYDG